MNMLNVIGCPGDAVPAEAVPLLNKADVIAAPGRLLKNAALPERAEKQCMDGKLLEKLPGLAKRSETETVVVLASGDPLYCGIGATLLRYIPAERLRFHPAPTAFQQLFARLGQAWEKSRFYSLHGKKSGVPYRSLLRSPLCAVYGDAERPAKRIAAELIAHFPAASGRPAAAGCRLGLPDETVIRGTLRDIADSEKAAASLSVLVLLPGATEVPELALGLPDNSYEHHENMITHPEIRAVAVSKLRPAPGVMWDLGAGSGSVGLEAAGLCPELLVHAVEKNPERFGHLSRNAEKEGLPNVILHEGNAAELLEKLPDPDRIFIGGGGKALLENSFARLRPGGLLVMTGVMVETVARMACFQEESRKELLTIQVSRARTLGRMGDMFQAENPITIAVWKKEVRK